MPSDIRPEHPVFKYLPEKTHPYLKLARVDRPIGTWLLLLPGWWSIVLASGGAAHLGAQGWRLVLLFAVGAFFMRAAGCVVNDLWDRDLDAAVERTRTRPLAAGEVTQKQALLFLAALLVPPFLILLTLPGVAIVLGFLALPLVAAYPFMKRVTWWPQAFLGITFNWGALMGWAAVENGVSAAAAMLYIGGAFWTLAYDTIYAHQDKEDDALIGVRSTARLFGDKSRVYVAGFFALAVLFFLVAKYMTAPGILTLLLLLPVAAHAFRQVARWDMDDARSCLGTFKSNRDFGLLVLLMLAL